LTIKNHLITIPDEVIMDKIYLIRGQKVMLDRDLAVLYGVETKYLKRQVKRNIVRFPEDFMFELTGQELKDWRSQFVTSNEDKRTSLALTFPHPAPSAVVFCHALCRLSGSGSESLGCGHKSKPAWEGKVI
jgi:hypothetical protein